MRRLAPVAVLALAACGGNGSSPPDAVSVEASAVVRAWSAQINDGDDEAAAKLFAPRARVIQGGRDERLESAEEARAWHRGLPCSGRIVMLRARGELVNVTFELGERPGHRCRDVGYIVKALFRVRGKKIVLWHQLGSTPPQPVA